MSFRSANGVIIAYDITKRDSFNNISHWLEDIRKYAGAGILQILIGNKRDLDSQREVLLTEAHDFALNCGMLDCIETSAHDNSNIEEVFVRMAAELKRRYGGPGDHLTDSVNSNTLQLNSQSVNQSKCCGLY